MIWADDVFFELLNPKKPEAKRSHATCGLDQWHFLAFVYDSQANSMHIYYDGILDETTVTTSLPVLAGVDLSIGADFEGTGNFFEGLIDGVAIYDQALTAEEIRGTY